MSSATLTDAPRKGRRAHRAAAEPSPATERVAQASGIRPWHFFLLVSTVLATVVTVLMHGQPPERMVLAVAIVAAAGYAGYALFSTLYPLVSEGAGEETAMIAGRTRAALERDKMLTLRAIKDLEFDRAMGKVAENDFEVMRDRLRARALRLITQLDGATAYREMIERDLAARIPSALPDQPVAASPGRGACAECGATNEADARFCKMCGRPLERTA
jgi:zinc ribbon protein